MPQVTCRCGELIAIGPGDPERIVCPRCRANIRLRRRGKSGPGAPAGTGPSARALSGVSETADGFLRFLCPCGRRLKVRAADRPEAGRCPDCNRIVPVPESAWAEGPIAGGGPAHSGGGGADARTDDLSPEEVARLNEWTTRHQGSPKPSDRAAAAAAASAGAGLGLLGAAGANRHGPSLAKFEAGLRVCPRCGKPVHMGSVVCRECGTAVPRGPQGRQ